MTATAKQARHTPGPWIIDGSYIETPQRNIARIGGRDPEDQANARLIAVAPDLLVCLRRLVEWDEYCEANADCGLTESQLRQDAEQWARTAIAKAEGRLA